MLLTEEQIIELTNFSMEYYRLTPKTIGQQFYIRFSDTDPNGILNDFHHQKEIVVGCLCKQIDYESPIDQEAFDKLTVWANDMSSRFPVRIDFEEMPEWIMEHKATMRYKEEIQKAIEQNRRCCQLDLQERTIDPQVYQKIFKLY